LSFWCYLRFSLEKPPAGSQAASGKEVYTTQGGVSQVGLSFHYAFEIIDDALKAFWSEEPGAFHVYHSFQSFVSPQPLALKKENF
jgi:hypothetical protein